MPAASRLTRISEIGTPQGGGGEAAAPLWDAAEGRGPVFINKYSKRCPKDVPRWPGTSWGHLLDIFLMTSEKGPKVGQG